MEADAEGVAHIAGPVELLPIAMFQTCQSQRSRGIALDRVADIEYRPLYSPENHTQFCTASSKLNDSLERGDGLWG